MRRVSITGLVSSATGKQNGVDVADDRERADADDDHWRPPASPTRSSRRHMARMLARPFAPVCTDLATLTIRATRLIPTRIWRRQMWHEALGVGTTLGKKNKLDDNGVILQIDSWTENYAKLLRDCTTDLQLSTKTIYAHGAPTRVLSLIIN